MGWGAAEDEERVRRIEIPPPGKFPKLKSTAKATRALKAGKQPGQMATKMGFSEKEIAQLERKSIMESGNLNNANISHDLLDLKFTNHALDRAIERGITRKAIVNTLDAPLKIEAVKIDQFGRPSQRFIGKKAEVVINPETNQIVSVNPTSSKKSEKLTRELNNAQNKVKK